MGMEWNGRRAAGDAPGTGTAGGLAQATGAGVEPGAVDGGALAAPEARRIRREARNALLAFALLPLSRHLHLAALALGDVSPPVLGRASAGQGTPRAARVLLDRRVRAIAIPN